MSTETDGFPDDGAGTALAEAFVNLPAYDDRPPDLWWWPGSEAPAFDFIGGVHYNEGVSGDWQKAAFSQGRVLLLHRA